MLYLFTLSIIPFHSGYSRGCRLPFHSGYAYGRRQRTWWLHLVFIEPVCTRSNFYRFSQHAKGLPTGWTPFVFLTAHVLMQFSEVWAKYFRKFLTFKNGRRRQVSDGSDIDYVGNELGNNFGSSSVSISSESNLDERHVVVLVKLFATCLCDRRTMCQYGLEICTTTQTFSVSKAPGLSAISINLSQRPFKEVVKQTRAGNV